MTLRSSNSLICRRLPSRPADAALQHIAAVCGPRYNPNKGLLKLTSDRYEHREANRAHIRKVGAWLWQGGGGGGRGPVSAGGGGGVVPWCLHLDSGAGVLMQL